MALLISIGNLGGAIGSNIFLAEQKPHYWLGYGMGLGMTLAAIIATMILRKAYISANKKRDMISEEEVRAKYTEAEMLGKELWIHVGMKLMRLQIWATSRHYTAMSSEQEN